MAGFFRRQILGAGSANAHRDTQQLLQVGGLLTGGKGLTGSQGLLARERRGPCLPSPLPSFSHATKGGFVLTGGFNFTGLAHACSFPLALHAAVHTLGGQSSLTSPEGQQHTHLRRDHARVAGRRGADQSGGGQDGGYTGGMGGKEGGRGKEQRLRVPGYGVEKAGPTTIAPPARPPLFSHSFLVFASLPLPRCFAGRSV